MYGNWGRSVNTNRQVISLFFIGKLSYLHFIMSRKVENTIVSRRS